MIEVDEHLNIQGLGLRFNNENIIKVTKSLISEPYGWGGVNNNRDCSLLIKDFFIPFGLFLPRNLAAQKSVGRVISFKDLTNEEKKRKIIDEGKPFKTLLYMKGHIMLYVGYKKKEPLVLHNFWGIPYMKKKKFQKLILGKGVITTLEPGKEINGYLSKYSLLNGLKSMSIVDL